MANVEYISDVELSSVYSVDDSDNDNNSVYLCDDYDCDMDKQNFDNDDNCEYNADFLCHSFKLQEEV